MNHSELSAILKQHKLWLESDGKEGKCADLRYADLSNADLRYANLSSANLRNADLRNANIRYADLRYADLRYADLSNANLRYADLSNANLSNADLSNANLSYADLRYADLCDADLRCANLSYADLDFSCLPLWCGSLKTHFDDRQIIQFLYHTLSAVQNSKNASEGLKKALLTETNVILANSFHRVAECGVIKIYEQSGEER